MNWEKTLDDYAVLIEEYLTAFMGRTMKEAEDYHPFIGKVYGDIREYVLRKGKRLASCSTLLIYKGYTGKVDEKILKVGIGVELYIDS